MATKRPLKKPIRGHVYVGIKDHPDDPECAKCGESKYDHKEQD